ncbi:Non-structural maintenance of chromosomes element 4 [Mycena venus]|uniref:Non-structural maintenance of chromosomes element 4 n=1 Tax=Mycena venus TaxID=2733690 RepID=A0A8H6Z5S6_9AGAR|nr:Non-structural maintenance of chromosomes element 4 [Mycena venus]
MASPRKEDLVYDPDQDVEVKRAIRRNYRELHKTLDDRQAEYTPKELQSKVERADELFADVKNPGEATLDSSFLVKTVNINIQKARALKFGTGAFSVDDFVTRLVGFMGGFRPNDDVFSDASDVEEENTQLDWGRVGRRAMAKSRRVPATGFMAGPLSIKQKQRAPAKLRATLEKNKKDETRPQEIREEDIARSENETTRNVAVVAGVLETVPKINFFKLVVNPNSFAQSVENVFYLSFLIRDAKVAFEITEDGEPMVFACEEPSEEDHEAAGGKMPKQQLIFEFDMVTWRRAIAVFDITESFIPTRARARTRLGNQWYG